MMNEQEKLQAVKDIENEFDINIDLNLIKINNKNNLEKFILKCEINKKIKDEMTVKKDKKQKELILIYNEIYKKQSKFGEKYKPINDNKCPNCGSRLNKIILNIYSYNNPSILECFKCDYKYAK